MVVSLNSRLESNKEERRRRYLNALLDDAFYDPVDLHDPGLGSRVQGFEFRV